MKTSLYRMYDADNQLLYVGISTGPVKRMEQHKSEKDWFYEVRHIEIEWFENREQALLAESFAILRERPLHNSQRPPERKLKTTPKKALKVKAYKKAPVFRLFPYQFEPPAPYYDIAIVKPGDEIPGVPLELHIPEDRQELIIKHCRPGDMIHVGAGVRLSDSFWSQIFERGAYRA